MNLKTIMASLVLVSVAALPAYAQTSAIQFSGQSWETGGFPPSAVGDELQAVGVVNAIEAPLYWQPWLHSYTLYMRELVSLGEVVIGTTRIVTYSNGLLSVYRDSLPSNHDYGINPPNLTSPSTFTDGDAIYLEGYFTEFVLTLNTSTQSGTFSGILNFTGGIVYPHLLNPDGWTLGSDIQGFSPAGYDLQLNGVVYANGPISTDAMSWGRMKELYR